MGNLTLTLVIKDYDYLAPLYGGDVAVEGFDLVLDRKTPMSKSLTDPSVKASEFSFSRYLIGTAGGDRSWVGIPFFAYRAFRHRTFFMRRDSTLRTFKDLEGKRVGTNEWPATGNTWARAALREQGVRIDAINWWVGPIDPSYPARSQGSLPPNVKPVAAGQNLRDMLLAGDLDALMVAVPPKGFYEASSRIIRLLPDYKKAERDYYQRTGVYPPQHIVAIRREVFDQHPEVAVHLYRALDRSRLVWQERRFDLTELTPWMQADMEEAVALMGMDWQPNGIAPNRKAIQALCDEELAQGLITRPLHVAEVFADFERVMKE